MDKVTISAKNLTIGYKVGRRETKILHAGLNFELRSGELTSLLGSNGSGKSTLIKTLCGFIPALYGEVTVLGRKINRYTKSSISKNLCVVLTDRIADGGLSVFDLVSLGRSPYTDFFGNLTRVDRRIIEESIAIVGIEELSQNPIASLSDGERQKAMIAKSLAQQSPIIILDEPTAFLDIKSRIEMTRLLHTISKEQNKTVLMSTHDMELALKLSDSLWTLTKGAGMECGAVEEMVLGGALDRMFTSSDVDFDVLTGSFRSMPDNCTLVELVADDLHHHWVANALRRNGFSVCESGGKCKIKVTSINNIAINYNNVEIDVSSVKEMVKVLGDM